MMDKFYVSLSIQDGRTVGHKISINVNNLKKEKEKEKEEENNSEKTKKINVSAGGFAEIMDLFVQQIESYRHFMTLFLAIAPEFVRSFGETQIAAFVKEKGVKKDEYCEENNEIYELDGSLIFSLSERQDEFYAMRAGARLLPKSVFVGLVSLYDAFIFALVRQIIHENPSLLFATEKQIDVKTALKFETIEDLRSHLVEIEVTNLTRGSHKDQIVWLNERLKLNVDTELPVWKEFFEICERRNLLVHTGGGD